MCVDAQKRQTINNPTGDPVIQIAQSDEKINSKGENILIERGKFKKYPFLISPIFHNEKGLPF